ncbi:membrane protein [Amycolatopsis bartoniae]|uniref:Membrane protein n=1 Tax=Amycolatopsis bartoniae TaxID=941986 RepID=A0A8H9IM55_9PSEU|nr:membrane protein [Amycolatopsis bartoniae]
MHRLDPGRHLRAGLPAAVAAYRKWGRPKSHRWQHEHGDAPGKPGYAVTATGVSHCGAGCTLGDIIAEFAVFGLGLSLAGESVYAAYIGDYLLALALGIVFQYFAIAPMRGLGVRKGLVQAAKADFLSLTAFEVGLFGWMALMSFVFFPAPHHLHPDHPVYWLGMQIGMIIGFCTAWPVNSWLIERGIKEAM